MNSQNTQAQNQFHAVIFVDQKAALLAGNDQYGSLKVPFKPSELSEQQRLTLAKFNFSLNDSSVGKPINGTESLTELLDIAAQKLAADSLAQAAEDRQCVDLMIAKLLDAPLADDLALNEETGQVVIQPAKPIPLLRIDSHTSAKRSWLDFFSGLWVSPATGGSDRAKAIRATVLSYPDVVQRLVTAEEHAAELEQRLEAARFTRGRLATEKRETQERMDAEAKIRRAEQLGVFVMTHMPILSQQKWANELLPESDIIQAMTAKTFEPLDHFKPINQELLKLSISDYCLDQLPVYAEPSQVRSIERTLEELTDEQFLQLRAIKEAVKCHFQNATVMQYLLVGYLADYSGDSDPEYCLPVVRVTVTVGEISLSREYALTAGNE
ncbi:hypothetical protein GO003_002810 [Methylicorpusculum oleiharenae]|uniref:hypothetical protein n=1 Tax=Methylicorpusculum oleiharenae TaxID=1338687 RepID=UPI001E5A7F24|nr:hypothetical protein [Methylicorpusculum oleiharenae]MCD2449319.1 hypothetical protein [Methylicorpusculum oleiharenae]